MPSIVTLAAPAVDTAAAAFITLSSVAAAVPDPALLVVRLPEASRKASWPPMVTLPVASTSNVVELEPTLLYVPVTVPVAGCRSLASVPTAAVPTAEFVNVKFLLAASYV
ncbi:hypothetical protein D3C85_1212360 [compost metagenome]